MKIVMTVRRWWEREDSVSLIFHYGKLNFACSQLNDGRRIIGKVFFCTFIFKKLLEESNRISGAIKVRRNFLKFN